jgi:DNA topoisomerase VI subunit B
MNGDSGRIDVVTSGRRHRIEVGIDRLAQKPKLSHTNENYGFVKNGTFIKIHLPGIAGLLENPDNDEIYKTPDHIIRLISNYTAFNPHATFIYNGTDSNAADERRTVDFIKWLPSNPTSPHWYSIERLRGLIAAYVNLEQNGGKAQSVRGFVAEFQGLKSTIKQKRVTDAAGLSRAYLHDLVEGDDISADAVKSLLSAMIENSKPVKPKALGLIGEDHVRAWMINGDVASDSIKYKKILGETDGIPFVFEVASGAFKDDFNLDITSGLNWSPALRMPFPELSRLLWEARVGSHDPFNIFVHLACPKLDFSDRGKGQLTLTPAMRTALTKAIKVTTKHITAAKRKADREDRLRNKQIEEMRKHQKSRQMTVRDAAFSVMEKAYMHASDDNKLPANARQIMYAARPYVIELTGKAVPWKKSAYFTQKILPDFQKLYSELTTGWDVVYDARGKLVEPHTNERVDLGTVAVRRYVNNWTNGCNISTKMSGSLSLGINTSGPVNRYRYALFVEKEGFDELWKSVELARR